MNILFLLILSALFWCWGSPSQAHLLFGEVDHSYVIAPIESSLAPGNIFDKHNLPQHIQQSLNDWYRIPSWLAGTWHKEKQTDYYCYNYLTQTADSSSHIREASSDGTWGTQVDSQGTIWQYDPIPYNEIVDSGDEIVVQIVRESEALESTTDHFIKRSIDTQLRVDKSSGKIKKVATGEEITIFTPVSDSLIKRETSAKVFDHDGRPLLLGKSFSYENKVTAFSPQNFFHGEDVHKLFQDFVKLSGVTTCLFNLF